MSTPPSYGLDRGPIRASGQAPVLLLVILLVTGLFAFVAWRWANDDTDSIRGDLLSPVSPGSAATEDANANGSDSSQRAPVATPLLQSNTGDRSEAGNPNAERPELKQAIVRDISLADVGLGRDSARMELLARLRRGQDEATRLAAAREILAGDTQGTPMLVRALETMAELDPDSVSGELHRLIDKLSDADPRLAQTVANAIRNLGRREGVLSPEDLASFFENGSTEIQTAAAATLSASGDESLAVRFQEQCVKDLASEDSLARAQAIRDLAALQSTSTLSLLRPLLADEDEEVRLQAMTALRQVGGRSVLEDIRPLQSDPSERISRMATRMVQMMERRLGNARGPVGGAGEIYRAKDKKKNR